MAVFSVEPLGVTPVDRATIHERVYEQLRDLLMGGHFRPGQTLTIGELADAFETSAQPVRDAIRQLVAEKALVGRPNRSAAVPIMDRAGLEDVRRARIAVEGLAAGLAAERATAEETAELEQLVEREIEADAVNHVDGLVAQNRAFHTRLYALSGSRVLPPIIDSLWLQVGPYIRPSVEHGEVTGGRSLHHVEVIDALRRRHPAEARAAIERDIDRFFTIAFEVVKTMEKRNVELRSVMP